MTDTALQAAQASGPVPAHPLEPAGAAEYLAGRDLLAAAGLLAGGLAATFYAAHCFDDSPLFVVTWYSLAIAGLTVLGALGGRRQQR